jgi:hypothetical protein
LNSSGLSLCQFFIACKGVLLAKADCGSSTWYHSVAYYLPLHSIGLDVIHYNKETLPNPIHQPCTALDTAFPTFAVTKI